MSPSLSNNDLIIVDKFLFRLFSVSKNDLLVFWSNGDISVKRVKGVSGDRVFIFENSFQVNPSYQPDQYLEQLQLREDELFMVGDNLNESIDSRKIGPINFKDVYGKVFLTL